VAASRRPHHNRAAIVLPLQAFDDRSVKSFGLRDDFFRRPRTTVLK
jgi:hypothetical protein